MSRLLGTILSKQLYATAEKQVLLQCIETTQSGELSIVMMIKQKETLQVRRYLRRGIVEQPSLDFEASPLAERASLF